MVWFKASAAVQTFEARLTGELAKRWPDQLPEVIAYDQERAWLLLADAGTPLAELGNSPEAWLEVLPRYAEMQRGEAVYAADHLAHGVPDLRLPEVFHNLSTSEIPASIQHDDLHMNNIYSKHGHLRILDWGDASISHPFASLIATFRFLKERNGLRPTDPWFTRLRDAYLEPWGPGLTEAFEQVMQVAPIAHVLAALRVRRHLSIADREWFDRDVRDRLRLALEAFDREAPAEKF